MCRRILLAAVVLAAGWLSLGTDAGLAQSTPTPTPIGPITVVTPTPTSPPVDDPRLTICSAPFQPGFTPHIVRPGERLGDLLIGVPGLSVTQVAALNCLDDPTALPLGAVIWLPPGGTERLIRAKPFDPDPAVDEARILALTASAEGVTNEAGVSFTWEAVGSAAYFYPCTPLDCARPLSAQPVPLAYTTPLIAGFLYAGTMTFRLEVVDGAGRDFADIAVEITCSQQALASAALAPVCPEAPPLYVFAAWQPFQRGRMVWFSDTRQIWVLTDSDRRVTVYPDRFTDGMAGPQAQAPPGLFVPERGFGLVWEQMGGGDSALGWATAPESGFDSARQGAGRVAYTEYILGPDGAALAVTILPGADSGFWWPTSPARESN